MDNQHIRLCKAMLIELRRWVYPLHPGAGASRWSAWARALLRRHGRIAQSYRLQEMALLVRPAPLIQRLHQQWLLASTQYFPRIHLAVQPILRHAVWRDLTQPSELRVIISPVQGKAISTQRFNYLTVHERRFLPPTAVSNATGILSGDRRKLAAARDARSSSGFIHGSAVYRPLQLVFQRLRRTDELEVCHRRNSLIRGTLQTQAREVMRRTQRFEHRIAETVALTTRKVLPLAAQEAMSAAARAAQMTMSGPAGSGGTPADPWPPGQAPAVNIEQLADQVVRQIDRRIIAARERMGRI